VPALPVEVQLLALPVEVLVFLSDGPALPAELQVVPACVRAPPADQLLSGLQDASDADSPSFLRTVFVSRV